MITRLSNDQRNLLAEKLMEWGNLVFIGLVIAQFVPGITSYQWQFIIMGLVGIVISYIIGFLVMTMKGGEKR